MSEGEKTVKVETGADVFGCALVVIVLLVLAFGPGFIKDIRPQSASCPTAAAATASPASVR